MRISSGISMPHYHLSYELECKELKNARVTITTKPNKYHIRLYILMLCELCKKFNITISTWKINSPKLLCLFFPCFMGQIFETMENFKQFWADQISFTVNSYICDFYCKLIHLWFLPAQPSVHATEPEHSLSSLNIPCKSTSSEHNNYDF